MSHSPHLLPRRVLGDDCDECVSRSLSLNGLSQLDDDNPHWESEHAETETLRNRHHAGHDGFVGVVHLRL